MHRRPIATRASSAAKSAVSASSYLRASAYKHRVARIDKVMDEDRYEAFHTEWPSRSTCDAQESPHISFNPSMVRLWMNSLRSSLVCSLSIMFSLAALIAHLERLIRHDKIVRAAALAQRALSSIISDDDLLSLSQPRPLFMWMRIFWYLSSMLHLTNILLCISAYGWLASFKRRPPHLRDAASFRYAGVSYRHIPYIADRLTPILLSSALLSMAFGLALYVGAMSYIGSAIMAIAVGGLFLLYITLAFEIYPSTLMRALKPSPL
ncbi:hypothetical protein CYLTODRAFT_444325 [Cylindrobasidium torrendii FP15055 ss-10]|uniref:DUF6535 domain-containing protein n=1 Tax=Cylindrobasidium torrendii FP15055 ss-10 TaxID=1314674 RepID=A0A0D7BBU0_9AGAR|nr:hypothetical protein CYLTODRAFT_444325 [Cylindrobasidium torrendii FP15055 ss-10]